MDIFTHTNLVWIMRLITPYRYYEYEKLITHIRTLSGEDRVASQDYAKNGLKDQWQDTGLGLNFCGGQKVQHRFAAAKSLQSCLTLCDPRDSSPPGSPVPGILQARTLEWVVISFSNAWKWKVKVKSLSCVRLLATPWTAAHQAPPSMGFSRQESWRGVPLPSLQHRFRLLQIWFELAGNIKWGNTPDFLSACSAMGQKKGE